MQALETMRDLMGQQAHNQAAITQAATTAAVAATVEAAAIDAPAIVPVENVVVPRERPIHKLVEQFLKLYPPRFTSVRDPKTASFWIQDLEKAFALLMCSEEKKVVPAVYQLQGNTNTWWRATRGTVFPEGVVLVWNAFLRAFNNKYFSSSTREQKMEEFQRLRQGMMSIDQYKAKFAGLS
ncbi:hypothetical protein ACJRO7_016213 [Eucalyptus globulus]|uniref:Retrotransposon gag domain-containing protein n=1 Tax=Eucalyptus globulus TaxID=34317 RepID=A0ABD3L6E5_EUCGL